MLILKVSDLKSISNTLILHLDHGFLEGFVEINKEAEIASSIPILFVQSSNKSKIPTQFEG